MNRAEADPSFGGSIDEWEDIILRINKGLEDLHVVDVGCLKEVPKILVSFNVPLFICIEVNKSNSFMNYV